MDKKLKRLIENGYSYEVEAVIKNGILVYQIQVFQNNLPISLFIEEENLNFDEPVIEKIIQYERENKINNILNEG
jgi:hypothetical protein